MSILDLSLPDLRAVATVASRGHFGRAAAALRIAQPTLSAQVRKVERALGTDLFERTGRSFLVTPAGERLLPLIRETLAAAERVGAEATEPRGGARPPLTLGVIPTLGPYLLPHLLLPLRRALPDLTLEIREEPTTLLLEALHEGELDAALLSLPARPGGAGSLESLPLFEEPFRLIAPCDHPILSPERLTPARMRACEMVLLEEGHCLRAQAIAVCSRRGGATPKLVTASLETLKYLVASGAGYSLLPALACDLPKGLAALVRVRAFDERQPARRIALFFRRTFARRREMIALAEFIRGRPPKGVRGVV